jgi:4-amino-4-deoxy-L-arabinose transferase-like glycosyltransferase
LKLPRIVNPRLGGWELLFVAVITVETILVGFAALVVPLQAWDSWVNWASRARVLFLDQSLSAAVYNDPSRLPTNLSYPLLLPLQEDWFFVWAGGADERAVGLVSLFFFLSLVLLFWSAACRVLPRRGALAVTALLASVPRVTRGAPVGLADLPMAALVLVSFLLTAETLDGGEQGDSLPLLALLAGLLPWLKDEGWLWLALLAGVVAFGLFARFRRGESRLSRVALAFTLFLAIAASVSAAWQLFLASRGTIRYVFLPLTLETLARNSGRLPEIARSLVKTSLDPAWNFVWPLVGLVLLVARRRALTRRDGWLVVPVVAFVSLGSLSYAFSRFEPFEAHLRNSVDRLLLQALPLALWWLAAQGAEAAREGARTR